MSDLLRLDPSQIRVEILDPDRNFVGAPDFATRLQGHQDLIGGGVAVIGVPFESDIVTGYRWAGNGQTMYESGASNWWARVMYRGLEFFDGKIVRMADEDKFDGDSPLDGVIDIELTCLHSINWFLRKRIIRGFNGMRYAHAAGVPTDTLLANLIIDNTQNNVLTPQYYIDNGLDRADFGLYTMNVVSAGAGPAVPVRARWDSKKSLNDASYEWCAAEDIRLSGYWVGTDFTLQVNYVGEPVDRTNEVKFTRGQKTLTRFKRVTDEMKEPNVAWIDGQGHRQFSKKGYAHDSVSIANVGLSETSENQTTAWPVDMVREQGFFATRILGAWTEFEAEVQETTDLYCGHDFARNDLVTVYCDRRQFLGQQVIQTIDLDWASPTRLRLGLGRRDLSDTLKMYRAGGGGLDGDRRAGGPASNQSNDPETWRQVCLNEGVTTADESIDEAILAGDPDTPCNPIWTIGVQGADEEGSKEQWLIRSCFRQVAAPTPKPPNEIECGGTVVLALPELEVTGTGTGTADCTGCCTPEPYVFPAGFHLPIIWTTLCDCDGYVDLSGISIAPGECCPDLTCDVTVDVTGVVTDPGAISAPVTTECETPDCCPDEYAGGCMEEVGGLKRCVSIGVYTEAPDLPGPPLPEDCPEVDVNS